MTGPHDNYDPHKNYTHWLQQHPGAKTKLDFHAYSATHSANELNSDATELGTGAKKIAGAPENAFGLSPLGQKVHQEVLLAHGKLQGAVDLLAKAMESYSTAVITAKKTMLDADGDVDTSMTTITKRLDAGDANAQTPIAAAPTPKDGPPPQTDPSATPPSGSGSGSPASSSTASATSTPFNPAAAFLDHDMFGPTFTNPSVQQFIDQLNQGGE